MLHIYVVVCAFSILALMVYALDYISLYRDTNQYKENTHICVATVVLSWVFPFLAPVFLVFTYLYIRNCKKKLII